jgi:predicted RNA-binding protein (virulence factor B family)
MRATNCLPLRAGSVHLQTSMALIGQRNLLPVLRSAPPGYYLDGGTHGEILLPGRYIPKGVIPGGIMDVFVYRDSEDRLVASTETAHAAVGEFALLRVISINPRIGVFLDWGLEKDLLLPIREQSAPLHAGDWIVVRVALDEKTDRIIASTRLNRYLNLTPPTYREGQPVKLIVIDETPLGYNAIVEHAHRGLLYHSDLAGPLTVGQPLDGYVRAVREDGKIDLALDRAGYRRIGPLTEQIVEALRESQGHLPYHDGSTPEEIRLVFGVSKKAFKQAIGALYRDRKITIEASGIRLAVKPGKLE